MANGLIGMQQSEGQRQGNLLGGIFQSPSNIRQQGRNRIVGDALAISQSADPVSASLAVGGANLGLGIGNALGFQTQEQRTAGIVEQVQRESLERGLTTDVDPVQTLNFAAQRFQELGAPDLAMQALSQREQFETEPQQPPAAFQNLALRAQAAGLTPGTRDYAEFMIAGGRQPEAGPSVDVDIDQRTESALQKEFAQQDAKTLSNVSTKGVEADRTIGQINRLSTLLDNAPQGLEGSLKFAAGNFGIPTENLSEIQAAQALINQIVPSQREPGSGPMSDADLELFKQSVPRLINQPGGNKQIIDTMREIAEYDKKGAEIVNRFRADEISRTEAFDQLRNRSNPLENVTFSNEAAAGQVPVTNPDGTVALLPNQEAANEYKQRIGIE